MSQPEPMIVKWHCVACGCVLGHIENKTTVRIKRKDLYVEVEGGARITELCYRCGKPNTLQSDVVPADQIDLQES